MLKEVQCLRIPVDSVYPLVCLCVCNLNVVTAFHMQTHGLSLFITQNIENAVGLLCALAKGLKPLLTSKEYADFAKVSNVLRNDKMAEEKLARGKKKNVPKIIN